MSNKKRESEAKGFAEEIVELDYADEMRESYVDYAVSVLGERALADVRDGLKPVQRRVLYSMEKLGLGPSTPFKKSARIVGDAMGKYHPHGDSSIYGALVTMSRGWVYSEPLVEGHGNFGNVEGDGAAAQRYTEARLSGVAKEYFFGDLCNGTVDFVPNFDETEEEPALLPARIPALLVYGSEGIGCGMAASIPPHNAGEVIDAALAYLKKPLSSAELVAYVKGPDFATGGIVTNASDLAALYETGSGKVRVRGRVAVESKPSGAPLLVVTEIPPTMVGGIDKFMEQVAELVRKRELPDVVDIANMTSKEGIRIEIELKKGSDPKKTEALLYKKTKLEDTFGANMLAVKDEVPHVYSLSELVKEFVDFQREICERKYTFLLYKEKKALEVKEGLLRACSCIDLIIEVVRGSKTRAAAKACLVEGATDAVEFKTAKSKKSASALRFTGVQADAILGMQLYSLIGLEIKGLEAAVKKLKAAVEKYERLLGSEKAMAGQIEADLKAARAALGRPRNTEITNAAALEIEEAAAVAEPCEVLVDRFGYAKVVEASAFGKQREALLQESKWSFATTTLDKIWMFTDAGMKYQVRVGDLPLSKGKEKGVPLCTVTRMGSKEGLVLVCSEEATKGAKLLLLASDGSCKLTDGAEFVSPISFEFATKFKAPGARLSCVSVADPKGKSVAISTRDGLAIKFALSELPEQKRGGTGVRGLKLKGNDEAENISNGTSIKVCEEEVLLSKLKKQSRDTVPVKP